MSPPDTNGSTASRLLGEAARLFRTQGYARSTIRQLGDRLGIRGASLYHHISSKEVLLYEICVRSLQNITEDFERAAATPGTFNERIPRLFLAHTERALKERDGHATMLTEFRELSPDHRDEVVRGRARFESLWRTQIEQGQAEGWVRDDIDAKYLTLTLLNMLNWTIFWYEPSAELSPEQLAGIFCSIFLDGAGGTPDQ